jgi:hypothetical protein
MNDRYMVIRPDTLEEMRRAGHAAKLEARIEKLEATLIAIKAMHHDGGIDDPQERDDRTYCVVCDALEGKDD